MREPVQRTGKPVRSKVPPPTLVLRHAVLLQARPDIRCWSAAAPHSIPAVETCSVQEEFSAVIASVCYVGARCLRRSSLRSLRLSPYSLPSDAEPSNAPLKTTSHNSRLNLPINGRGRSQAMLRRRPWPYGQKEVTLLRLESLSAAQPARYQDPWCVVGVAPFFVSV